MRNSSLKHQLKSGLNTLLSSITFFYGHLTILSLALIPSSIRAYQMLESLETPLIFELIVESVRVVMIILMVPLLMKRERGSVKYKAFWEDVLANASSKIKENFPHVFIGQFVVFILLLAGLGNLLLIALVNGSLSYIMELFSLNAYPEESVYNARLYFLKNISVIPLSMVYILKMCGVGQGGTSKI